jgi:hypothetical protein
LAPIEFLADFIALARAFRVNILTMVFTTTLPIRLALLPRWGYLTQGLSQSSSGIVLCPVVYLDLLLSQVNLDFEHPLADVKLLL